MEEKVEWFENWFDTPYYHILYKNRDFKEAEKFIDALYDSLPINKESTILDLACGKGRHSIYLNKKGLNVTGADLSKASIEAAKQYENQNLKFEVFDMRNAWGSKFDVIFNLFTSFGYFETGQEDFQLLSNIYESLNLDGIFVLDYINIFNAIDNMVPYEEKTVDNIDFQITKSFEDNKIKKTILFFNKGTDYKFHEKLNCHTKNDLITEMTKIGFTIENIYGDYSLNSYNETESDRIILVGRKK